MNEEDETKEFKVHWQGAPNCNYPRKVDFVLAKDKEAARSLIKDHIERKHGIGWYSIHSIELYEKPEGGRVL